MKNWKKAWKEELDSIMPELSDDVKNAPIPVHHDNIESQTDVAVKSRYNSRRLLIAAVSVLLCLAIAGTILLVMKRPTVNLFTVEINPAISITTDEKGKVTGVAAINEDADVILSNKNVYDNLIGKQIDEAVKYYVDYAARLGYLDISEKGSAVRVSGCVENKSVKLLDNVALSLKNYFTHKGVYAVVVVDTISVEEYNSRSGIIITGGLSDISKAIINGETFASNRNAQNMSKEQLQAFYKELIGGYDELMLNNIKTNVNKIVQSAQDINELYELNKQIEEHEDNPSWLTSVKDYWTVKSIYPVSSYTESFNELMTAMENALQNYKSEYDIEFTDKWTLLAAKWKYDSLPVSLEELQAWFNSLTVNLMETLWDMLSDVMELAGVLEHELGELMKLPSTVEEFVTKTSEVLQRNFTKRLDEYKETYEQVRQEITQSDYDSFLADIVEQYGSLNDYWNSTR